MQVLYNQLLTTRTIRRKEGSPVATRWIDFAAIKRQVAIRDVLSRYGFLAGLKEKKGGSLSGPCPIHGGDKGSNSFHVDTGKNIWNCFSACEGGGNVLDLVMKVEGCSIREASEKLADWFGLSFERSARAAGSAPVEEKGAGVPTGAVADTAAGQTSRVVPVGPPPLERPLAGLNADHPYLFSRGLTVPTIKTFGVGYCVRGLMRGRIAIPIEREDGAVVAYAGRAVDETTAAEKGKYRFPENFPKSAVVYNLHRAKENGRDGLIVVEGFFDAMKVHQAGFTNVVALMGSTLSERQEELLVSYVARLVLMFDGDEAGRKCVRQFYGRLRTKLFLREVQLADGEQPDGLPHERIQALLG